MTDRGVTDRGATDSQKLCAGSVGRECHRPKRGKLVSLPDNPANGEWPMALGQRPLVTYPRGRLPCTIMLDCQAGNFR